MDTNTNKNNKNIIDNKLLNHTSTNKKQINNLSNNLSNNLNNDLSNKTEKKEKSMYKIYMDYMVSRN